MSSWTLEELKETILFALSILILIKKLYYLTFLERILEIIDALLTLEQKLKLEIISFQSDSRFLLYRVQLHCVALFLNTTILFPPNDKQCLRFFSK